MLTGEAPEGTMLAGVRVLEVADEQGEYTGLLLAGLGAEVIKVEPPGGSATRRIGPFRDGHDDPESSLYFWQYNRAKRSVVLDLDSESDRVVFRELAAKADVLLETTPRDHLSGHGVGLDTLRAATPALITARMSAFGDSGPWGDWKGSDLVHLALGGVMMNCGYDPRPDGTYDLPPIAPQMWHAYHIAGEQMAMMIVGALVQRQATGLGQHLSEAIHEAVSKCTEMDLTSWTMRAIPFYRQTCRHASQTVSSVPTIAYTKDGRWILIQPTVKEKVPELLAFLKEHGMDEPLRSDFERLVPPSDAPKPVVKGRYIPGSSQQTDLSMLCQEALQRLFAKFTFEDAPWREAQEAGVLCAPLRRPEENVDDAHWRARRTFAEVEHPEVGESFSYITSKWVSNQTSWAVGRRAPVIDEDGAAVRGLAPSPARSLVPEPRSGTATDRPFPLAGVRVFDFSWFLATAGGTRFLAAMGADVIKVEWKGNPDTRLGLSAMAPKGGRAARDVATGPLEAISADEAGDDYHNMGGQFHIKNPGKRGISLNVRDPRGLEIAKRLVCNVRHRRRGLLARGPREVGPGLRRAPHDQAGHHLRPAVRHGGPGHVRPAADRRTDRRRVRRNVRACPACRSPQCRQAGAIRIWTGWARTASPWRWSRPFTTGTQRGGPMDRCLSVRSRALRRWHDLPRLFGERPLVIPDRKPLALQAGGPAWRVPLRRH